MALRLNWFEIAPFATRDLQRLAERFLAEKYSHQKGFGFVLTQIRDKAIEGSFIERELVVQEITDPFGETKRFEITTFRTITFSIRSAWPQMEIVNAPRSVAVLFNLIGEYLNFKISITPITFGLNEWLNFCNSAFSMVTITKAVVADIAVGPSVNASAVFEGNEDVQRYIKDIVKGRRFHLDSITVQLREDESFWEFDVSRSGRLRILKGPQLSSTFFRDLLKKIRRAGTQIGSENDDN